MLRFWILLIVGIALFALLVQLLSQYNFISRKMRSFMGILLIAVAIGIGIFNFFQERSESQLTSLAQMFLQGQTLRCRLNQEEILANKEDFNFVSGTLTLMGKEQGKYMRVAIPLKMCKGDNATSN